MNHLRQLTIILLMWFAGELCSTYLIKFIPGNVLGMLFLFIFLVSGKIREESVQDVADFFLKNLAFLFLPAGVGIMSSWILLKDDFAAVAFLLVVSTALTMVFTSFVVMAAGGKGGAGK